MKRTPKAIGTTAGETPAARWLQDNGWPTARRQPLTGNRDQGDIVVCDDPKIIAEVKAGWQTEKASPAVIAEWLHQTETEAVHAGADLAVLIVARKYRNPAQWDAWMCANDWTLLLSGDSVLPTDAPWPLRSSLQDWSCAAKAWVEGQ